MPIAKNLLDDDLTVLAKDQPLQEGQRPTPIRGRMKRTSIGQSDGCTL
jgi:hypothetical protein